jgi:hypothetical protein
MEKTPEWLPPLVSLDDYGGDWHRYVEGLYAVFTRDFIRSRPSFEGQLVRLKKHAFEAGKEATFWHLISSGRTETDRVPEMRRCERIGWPRALIEAVPSDRVRVWRNQRSGGERIVIALADFSYIVVLAIRTSHVVLWTAYCVEDDHRRRKLQKEWEQAQKN